MIRILFSDCKGTVFFLYVNVLFVMFYVQKRKISAFGTQKAQKDYEISKNSRTFVS